MSAAGVVLVASMFVDWIDVVGLATQSGLGVAWDHKHWLFLVPVVGAVLAVAAGTRSEYTRFAAIAAGVVVAGDVMFSSTKSLVFNGGVATWLVFGGAGVVLGGVASTRRSWRIVGGIAVLAGFFAPWERESMVRILANGQAAAIADSFGIALRVLWLVPVAGIAAIASGLSSHAKSGQLALVAGIAVFGSVAWLVGSVANLVFAWGAWGALGASAVALLIGVFVPGVATRPALAAKT